MARRIQLHPEVTLARLEEALKAPLPKKKRRRLEAMRLALIRKAAAAFAGLAALTEPGASAPPPNPHSGAGGAKGFRKGRAVTWIRIVAP